jgi:hypothetical protein
MYRMPGYAQMTQELYGRQQQTAQQQQQLGDQSSFNQGGAADYSAYRQQDA